VAGTGDLSFEVGQGEGRESRLASDDPAPSIDIDAAAPTTAATPGTSPSPPARTTGVGVQVGAYSSRASAEAGWNQLRGRFEALSGLNHRILEGTADSGTIYRLQAVASDGRRLMRCAARSAMRAAIARSSASAVHIICIGLRLKQAHIPATPAAMTPAIFGLSGTALTADERAFFREADPAGYILFGRNVESRDQLRALTDDLRTSTGATACWSRSIRKADGLRG
jgi:hypothetical protein